MNKTESAFYSLCSLCPLWLNLLIILSLTKSMNQINVYKHLELPIKKYRLINRKYSLHSVFSVLSVVGCS